MKNLVDCSSCELANCLGLESLQLQAGDSVVLGDRSSDDPQLPCSITLLPATARSPRWYLQHSIMFKYCSPSYQPPVQAQARVVAPAAPTVLESSQRCHIWLQHTPPPESAQPQKLCTANFSSGTLKTLINRLLRLKNKTF